MRDINLKEKTIHGNSMFPLRVYSITDLEGKYFLPLHWHSEIEIVYVEEGTLSFNIDMSEIKVSKGNCIFINSEQLHSAHSLNEEPSIHHAIVFDLNILNSSIYDYCQNKYIDPLLKNYFRFPKLLTINSPCGDMTLREILEIINAYATKNIGWELNIKASLLKIVANLAQGDMFLKDMNNISLPKDYNVEQIKKILTHIHNNFNKKIHITDLAKISNMNPQYFCRFFKSLTGKTPVTYINHYRIEKACKLIKTEEMKIMDICLTVGFDNFSYFIKKFKEYKNCTPSQYRNLNTKLN